MFMLRGGEMIKKLVDQSLHGYLTFQEIMDATNNFSENMLLGVGGSGECIKEQWKTKRKNPRSKQGLAEFRTEIEMLSKLRHRHLVSLIGYCDERLEKIPVLCKHG
ncbi:putative non-specific serine/threonine protein kinase [Helianthus annuus]|nr:putative non-specific serine/threonine protein kinase [Helianthus annuus]KAJ0747940.1 putative non-specific serine/threonine protein kinase [Helianthus annuus]